MCLYAALQFNSISLLSSSAVNDIRSFSAGERSTEAGHNKNMIIKIIKEQYFLKQILIIKSGQLINLSLVPNPTMKTADL